LTVISSRPLFDEPEDLTIRQLQCRLSFIVSITAFQPGQRWVSNTESELGLGIVLNVANRRVEISFPAVGETRHYAVDNAPLSRVQYEVGQRVSNHEDHSILVTEIAENNGCVIYFGTDENGNEMVLPEIELNSFVQFSKPQDRIFAGQIDHNRAFELRMDTLRHSRRLQQSGVAGLLGPRIQLLPHQLYIASEVANRYAPRVLLADEVGLGKTIEAGLVIHHQLLTGRAKRVLLVLPDSLIHQWLVEMLRRFNLMFTILDEERCQALEQSGSENPFDSAQIVITPLSLLSDEGNRLQQAVNAEWDLLVVDEAHHLAWSEHEASPAYQAVEALSQRSKGLLLLTATPEQLGIEGHFARLRLLDPARYFNIDTFRAEEAGYASVNELVQKLVSIDDEEPLEESMLRDQLGSFLDADAVDSLLQKHGGADAGQVEFRRSLIRELLDRHGTGRVLFRNTRVSVEGFPQRSLHAHPLPAPEQANEGDPATMPDKVLGTDWTQNDPRIRWLVDHLAGRREAKVLVICARAETAIGLEQHLKLKHGVHSAVFHEGMTLVARDRAAAYFADSDQGAQVLVCSEIGSEGRNFQFSHQLVLFDLPINPDLLEQRIGRLDRIGQHHDIQVHVPYFTASSQEILLRWYHEGCNAFEATCAIGQALYARHEEDLLACMAEPTNVERLDKLLAKTAESAMEMLRVLLEGRDRLLELNSCDQQVADEIIDEIHEQEQRHALTSYMDRVMDQFGIEQEHHSAASVILRPAEHMQVHSFPALKEDGMTATYSRDVALSREDFDYLTWEHPMVTGAMDMIINGEFGNTAFLTMKLAPFKTGTILLESVFTLKSQAPSRLQLHRFLPLTSIRIVIDSQHNDLSKILTEKHFSKLGKTVRRFEAQTFIGHTRKRINRMIGHAEQMAGEQQKEILAQAAKTMNGYQQAEQDRLVALARVNPNIRQEEISYLETETAEMRKYLELAHVRLDAIRLVVISD
jgi:ATP-dependent helicase HepA